MIASKIVELNIFTGILNLNRSRDRYETLGRRYIEGFEIGVPNRDLNRFAAAPLGTG